MTMARPGQANLIEREMVRRSALGIRPGLERILGVLEALGSPQRALGRTLVVAGTNGKGSVTTFAHAILLAAGFDAAAYTSPHLLDVCERVRVGAGTISPSDFDAAGCRVLVEEEACGFSLTGFEFVTAAAFLAIADHGPDCTVLEVGLGGRLDATNVTAPAAAVITPLGLEHTDFLGNSLVSIAGEKLGVAREGVPCVLAEQPAEAAEFLLNACAERGILAIVEGRDFSATGSPRTFSFRSRELELCDARLALDGQFQVQNAGLAVAACRALVEGDVPLDEACRRGLAAAAWPGRFDLRQVGRGRVLFDGAHNAEAASALAEAYSRRWKHRPVILVALKKDKNAAGVLGELLPLARSFVFTDLPWGEAHPPGELARLVDGKCPVEVEPDPDAALRRLLNQPAAPEGGGAPNVCCGSLLLVGYYLQRVAPPKDVTEPQS